MNWLSTILIYLDKVFPPHIIYSSFFYHLLPRSSRKSFILITVLVTRQNPYTHVSNDQEPQCVPNGYPRDRLGEGGVCLRPWAFLKSPPGVLSTQRSPRSGKRGRAHHPRGSFVYSPTEEPQRGLWHWAEAEWGYYCKRAMSTDEAEEWIGRKVAWRKNAMELLFWSANSIASFLSHTEFVSKLLPIPLVGFANLAHMGA